MTRILKDYPSVALLPQELDGRIDFARLFGRDGAIHIEIGCGKGIFLLNEAKAHPEINFLGVERANKYYRYAVDRIGRRMVKNVRIIRIDAVFLLTEFVPQGSVDCFHIYFPDPWPKKRHNKRRLFNSANMELLICCLKDGGVIRTATDHSEYFEQIQRLIAERADKLGKTEFLPASGAGQGEWVGTNFERKYAKEQRPVFCVAVRKKP
jgi:tRNA (guanine-N7-)-methyltransferase